jgi:hypothetical protein
VAPVTHTDEGCPACGTSRCLVLAPVTHTPTATLGELVDRVDDLLRRDEPVPRELAIDLLVAMPQPERERWLRTLVELAWRPAEEDPTREDPNR